VDVLLEVMPEREIEERPRVGGGSIELVRAALNDGEVAGRQVAIEVVDVRDDLRDRGAAATTPDPMRGPRRPIMLRRRLAASRLGVTRVTRRRR